MAFKKFGLQVALLCGLSIMSVTAAIAVPNPPAPDPDPDPDPDPSIINAPFDSVDTSGWQATWTAPPTGPILETAFTVDRLGFNASAEPTYHREDILVTRRMRQAFPNHTLQTTNKVVLQEFVYSGDIIHGGAVNNSAETSPAPVGKWATMDREVIGNTLRVAAYAYHKDARKGRQVAAFAFDLVYQGEVVATQVVSTTTLSNYTGWAFQIPEYVATFDVSAYPNNSILIVRARIFPWFGGPESVYNTNEQAFVHRMRNAVFLKDTAKAANPPIAVVNLDGEKTVRGKFYGAGVSNGVVSTDPDVARATPFNSVANAMAALNGATYAALTNQDMSGCRIWFASSIPTATAWNPLNGISDRTYSGFGFAFARDPFLEYDEVFIASLSGNLRMVLGRNAAIDAGLIRFVDLKWKRGTDGSALQLQNGSTAQSSRTMDYMFINCQGDCSGSALHSTNARSMIWWGGSYVNPGGAFAARSQGVNVFRGITAVGSAPTTDQQLEIYDIAGCDMTGFSNGVLNAGRGGNDLLIYSSAFYRNWFANSILFGVGDISINGAGWINVLAEQQGAGDRIFRLSGDSNVASHQHIGMHSVTGAGSGGTNGGWNNFYDEGGTARSHELLSVKSCITASFPQKGDVFVGNGARLGHMQYNMGVGCRDNYHYSRTGFPHEYLGNGSIQAPTVDADLDPKWVNPQVTGGAAGLGRGDYRLQIDSPCRGMNRDALISHDLFGVERPLTGDHAGACI